MKICILGPVNTSKYFGGVAVFTQGLAAAFAAKGYKVQIITHYAEQERTNGNVPIITVSSSCWRKNPVVPFRIAEKIVEFNPDLIISSLEFGLANRVLRHKGYGGTIIHFLHAFPAFYQRVVHNIFIDKVTKYIAAYSDFVIANSEYTASINELYGLKSDAIMNVCVGDEFFNELKKINKVTKRAGTVIFAGRLVREKQVDKLIRAFSNTKLGVSLTIIGDGPEKDALEALAAKTNKQILFLGSLSQRGIVDYYVKSDVFVSLCPHESFGIVYLEALAANCKVICPRSGGHTDVSLDFPERVTLVSNADVGGLTKTIDMAIQQTIAHHNAEYWAKIFSYRKLVGEIEAFLSIAESKYITRGVK